MFNMATGIEVSYSTHVPVCSFTIASKIRFRGSPQLLVVLAEDRRGLVNWFEVVSFASWFTFVDELSQDNNNA
jgi:hypothetical protein